MLDQKNLLTAIPLRAAPITSTFDILYNSYQQSSNRTNQSSQPETMYDLGFVPSTHFKMMMKRCHFKNTFFRFSVISNLNNNTLTILPTNSNTSQFNLFSGGYVPPFQLADRVNVGGSFII